MASLCASYSRSHPGTRAGNESFDYSSAPRRQQPPQLCCHRPEPGAPGHGTRPEGTLAASLSHAGPSSQQECGPSRFSRSPGGGTCPWLRVLAVGQEHRGKGHIPGDVPAQPHRAGLRTPAQVTCVCVCVCALLCAHVRVFGTAGRLEAAPCLRHRPALGLM